MANSVLTQCRSKLVIISIIVLFACKDDQTDFADLEGKPLPSFQLLMTDGKSHLHTKDIPTNSAFVMILIGPQCPYSKAQIEEITKNISYLSDIPFYVFTPYPYLEMKQFDLRYQLSKYKNIHVGIDSSNFYGDYMGVFAVPFIAIYDKNKKLIKAYEGKTSARTIVELVNK
ncbi:hypothetical protein [Paraflavitalea sp. CAU 1676]|uniref:hypothetical protein n=1 Tax=Paraflavitalea sp. CAU 1676 TaxID=3032598 RepID=UPI0023D9C8FA|nr:hypothetical protein [Paraflavitalea sp. CAU 1676]MDF2192606.1 hypothetical protein [Paraflavitalea sp. CAU 1676]